MDQTTATLHPISLGMVKAFLIQGDQAILVDTGASRRDADKILATMAELGIEPSDLALIVITHAHTDHCSALATLHHRTGAQIAIQEAGAEVLRLGISAEIRPASFLAKLLSKPTRGRLEYEGVEPDTIYGEEMDLYPFGVNARVLHTPGHTPCSSSVLFPGGDVVVGDLVMGMPRPRVAKLPHFATNPSQVKESIRELLDQGAHTFHTGHGGPFSAEEVRKLVS